MNREQELQLALVDEMVAQISEAIKDSGIPELSMTTGGQKIINTPLVLNFATYDDDKWWRAKVELWNTFTDQDAIAATYTIENVYSRKLVTVHKFIVRDGKSFVASVVTIAQAAL